MSELIEPDEAVWLMAGAAYNPRRVRLIPPFYDPPEIVFRGYGPNTFRIPAAINGIGATVDRITWPFPTWAIRSRPYDWSKDSA